MMKYFKNAEGMVYAYESDGSQDEYILPDLFPMSDSEVQAHLNPSPDDVTVETEWRTEEMEFIANNLLYIEDENDLATAPLVLRDWRNYRRAVMAWDVDNPDFPQPGKRPVRPA